MSFIFIITRQPQKTMLTLGTVSNDWQAWAKLFYETSKIAKKIKYLKASTKN